MSRSSRFLVLLLISLFAIAGCSDDDSPTGVSTPEPVLDSFDDGSIDTSLWESGGSVTEAGGMLQIRRDGIDDYIQSTGTYSGNWTITLEIRLNSITWHDMFHGISLRGDDGAGMSFGFSQYGKLYQGVHRGTSGTSFNYGPDGSNRAGELQTWVFTRRNGEVTVTVDGSEVDGIAPVEVPNAIRISLPGYYSDGDGAGPLKITSSDVMSFGLEF
ncbi:hypothetical protein DRQ53_04645 [bacterium]|nr:MAG: hypothetical protein DRQ32_11060 [bacterium]RKZ17018.1 MAG: hypothetical protein DRQ53_04645 [bacterium]